VRRAPAVPLQVATSALILHLLVGSLPAQEAVSRSSAASVLDRVVRTDFENARVMTALESLARAAGVRLSYSRESLDTTRAVTLRHRAITLGAALTEIVEPDGLEVTVSTSGLVIISPKAAGVPRTLRGRTVDAVTGAVVPGASVWLGERYTLSDAAGDFTLHGVEGRVLSVRRIGYLPRTVMLEAGGQPLTVALEPAPIPLDRLIVMGSESETPARAAVAGVTVITREDLERGGWTSLEDVIRTHVPGVVLWDDGPGAAITRTGSIRGASSFTVNFLKTYVDGVEVATPYLPLLVDPASIERIEVIRGPQGAALYGSNANSGVLQIITRRAAQGRNLVSALVERGRMDSRFATDAVGVDEYAAEAAGAAARAGARIAARRMATGTYAPGSEAALTTIGGAAHVTAGFGSLELAMRSAEKQGGLAVNPIVRELVPKLRHGPGDSTQGVSHRTASLLLRVNPARWALVRVAGGTDHTELQTGADPFPWMSQADSFFLSARGNARRTSGRASVEVRLPDALHLSSMITLGVDGSSLRQDRSTVRALSAAAPEVGEVRESSSGTFAQASVNAGDFLYLLAGMRRERNSAFGSDYGAASIPMYGAALLGEIGAVTVKLRGAGGKGIRPPAVGAADATTISNELVQMANPDLAPESQTGSEWGVDLFVAGNTRLQFTAYRQRAEGLVQYVLVDPRSKPRGVQQQNIGTIVNRGWEMEASQRAGPFRIAGTYTRTDSRVARIAPRYEGTLRAGDRTLEVPAWTRSITASFARGPFNIAASANAVGDWINYDWVALYEAVHLRQPIGAEPRNYLIEYPGFTTVRASASFRVLPVATLTLRGENLTNVQRGARDNLHVNTGRTIVVGVRAGY
jgi:iron complex outermembrane receptor protein